MKTFLVIILALVLALASAISVSAAPIVFYLDTLPSGTVEKDGHAFVNGEDDINVTILSGGTMFGKYKVGAEYGVGKIEADSGDEDLSLWGLKGGYRFYDARATKLDAMLVLMNITTESKGKENELNGTLVGLDFTQYFSEKVFISGSIVYAINGSYDYATDKDNDASIALYRLKFHYFITEDLGVVLGYTDLGYEFKHSSLGGAAIDVAITGLSLGALYKF